MPRTTRTSFGGALHHVMTRCNHQERLFSKTDLQDCCAILLETKQRFPIRLFAYAFLSNHYHLLIQEEASGTLGEAMHWFNGTVACRYNIRHGTRGHLWQGRFKNRCIQSELYFIQCMIYIDLNPARAGLSPQVTNWPFSSARAHAEGIRDPLLDSSPIESTSYKQRILTEWDRTQQLQHILQDGDREATRSWLKQASSRIFIPFSKEISLLVGSNFRRYISPSTEPENQSAKHLFPGLYESA